MKDENKSVGYPAPNVPMSVWQYWLQRFLPKDKSPLSSPPLIASKKPQSHWRENWALCILASAVVATFTTAVVYFLMLRVGFVVSYIGMASVWIVIFYGVFTKHFKPQKRKAGEEG